MSIDYQRIADERGLIYNGRLLPYAPSLQEHARLLRNNMTKAEKMLWYEVLRHLDVRVHRQRPIDHYIVDFYIPAVKLVIELDGEHHFSDEGKRYDAARDEILGMYGLAVFRIENQDVVYGSDMVKSKIEALILKLAKSY